MTESMVFDTPKAIQAYQAITLKHAIKLYARTGMKVNRAYTPSNMLKSAGLITGKTFKRGQYDYAIAALDDYLDRLTLPGCDKCGQVLEDGECGNCGAEHEGE